MGTEFSKYNSNSNSNSNETAYNKSYINSNNKKEIYKEYMSFILANKICIKLFDYMNKYILKNKYIKKRNIPCI